MKKKYIAPQAGIESLALKGSVMEGDPGYAKYSDTTDEAHANSFTIEEETMEANIVHSSSLWDE